MLRNILVVSCLAALLAGCASSPQVTSTTPGFSLAAAPTTLSITSGSTGSALTVASLASGGFASAVTVTLSNLPAGVTASPAMLSLMPGQLGQMILTASSTAADATTSITVTGVSGALTQTATANIAVVAGPVPDFTLSADPALITATDGGPAQTLSVTAAAVNGFTGPVSVTLNGLPTGVSATPATLSVMPGQAGQFSVLASNAAAATALPLALTGTSGALSHMATSSLTVVAAAGVTPDFSLLATPTVSLVDGGAGQPVIFTATSTNGFAGSISIAPGALPAGIVATPATVTIAPGQLGQIVLTATNAAAVTAAPLTFTGTSGSVTHTATTSLTVAPAAAPDFTLSATPTLSLIDGSQGQSATLLATALNGFAGTVTVTPGMLPAGVTASPATVAVSPGQPGQIVLTATTASVTTGTPVTFTGSSGTLTHSATSLLSVGTSLTTAGLSTSNYSFSGTLVGSHLTQQVVTVTNTGSATLALNPVLTGDPSYAIVANQSCGLMLAPATSCQETISYTPTVASGAGRQNASLNLGFGNVALGTPQTVALSGVSAVLPVGVVTGTPNPQVAQYTITLPFPGSIVVNFGPDTTYGRSTWSQSTATAGGQISMLVAGMYGFTQYHMQAAVTLANGVTAFDTDHTFTTGAPMVQPQLSAETTAGMTPQPGIEELMSVTGTFGIVMTDLQAKVIWSYTLPNSAGATYDASVAKLLPNGHLLLSIGEVSTLPLTGSPDGPTAVIAIREIDLAGNIIKEINRNALNNELAAAGYNISLLEFHHDVTPLPNGHWLVLANTFKSFTDLPGYPGVTKVLGDVVIDLDQNLQPVWVWNEFDHLDINRHPYMFPDWTHTNAIVYSPSDGNLIISMRHQNWVVKVDYLNGTGAGDILWRLGEGGDFTLVGGVDPTDWHYAQHNPSLFTTNSSGNFELGLMDNGDDRIFPAGVTCNTTGAPVCNYTTIPVYQIDEGAKTATLVFHQILDPTLYSYFGGNTELLPNGNIEYDLAASYIGDSDIFEVTPTSTPQTVWHMHSQAANDYRAYRIPSLYPGVQW